MHHLLRTRLAPIAVAAIAVACSTSKGERPPNPLATMRLAPASVSAAGIDAARILDRDTTTGAPVVAPATVTFRFAHAVEVRRVKAIGAGVRVSAEGASLELDGTGWGAAATSKPFWTDALTLSVEPRAAGARLDEIEVWGAGLAEAPREARALAVATKVAQASPFENLAVVRADGMPATLSPAGLDQGSDCVRASLRTTVPIRQVRRAYLAYEANVQRATVLRRSFDGAAPVGGFWLAATTQVRTLADELDPERITGDDSVLLCLPDDATGAVTIDGLRLLLVTDDGRDVFDRETRLALPEATDGDPATAAAVHAVRLEAALDRTFQLDEAEVGLSAAPARLSAYGLFDGNAWSEQGTLPLDATRTPLPLAATVAQAAEVTFAGSARTDVPAAGLAELAFTGSGVGARVAVPRLVLTSPAIRYDSGRWVGERFDGTAYVAGWAESPAGPGVVTVGGIDAAIDGAFGVRVTRPQGATGSWDVVVRATFPGGATVERTIHLEDDRQTEILQDGAVADMSLSSDQRFGREDQTQWGTADGDGGRVTLGTEASVDVPARALSAKTTLGISRKGPESIPQLEAGMINVTAPANSAYRFLPKGQKFAVPAQITLPYDPGLLPEGVLPEEIRTYYFDEKEDRWIALPRRQVVRATQRVLSETTHFTFMINAVLVLPDHPGPASFNPNSIKDLAAADPSAGIDLVQPPDANAQGSAQLVHPIRLPKARGAHQPDLRLAYDSSGGNGWAGFGWDLPVSSVQLDTRWGVPEPGIAEPRYLLDGAQLVPTGEQAICEGTAAPGALFRERIAKDFKRVVRCGTYPDTWFEVSDRAGTLFVYGFAEPARLRSPRADRAVGQWFLERVVDLNGNLTEYGYDVDVRGPADATEGEPFVQVYLRSIRYTGRASRTGSEAVLGGTSGPYVVDVYAKTDGGGALASRPDVIVSGRLGFKVLTRRLLGRVRVSLDPGSTAAGQSGAAAQPIREYELDYDTSSLGKSRVGHVRTYGFDAGGQRSLFFEHGFEYEDPDVAWPFGHETVAWSFDDAPDEDQAVRTQEKSKSKGGGLSFGIGIFSLGGSVSKTNSTTSGETVFADVNGDGLPDRIYRAGNGVSVAQFNAGLPEGATSGHFTPNLPDGDPAARTNPGQIPIELGGGYGWSKVKSARAAVLFVGAKLGKASGTSISNAWTADVDGDGYLDMITPGGVLFGNPRTAASPGFSYAPTKFGLPGQPGGVPPGVDDGRVPSDAVLEWIAPYDGLVDVSGSFGLVDRPRPPADPAWDGVRLRIYRADEASPGFAVTMLYETTTDASKVKTPEAIALSALQVASGTRLYFVLSTLSNFPVDLSTGSPLEETEFAPVIAYAGATSAQMTDLDPTGAPSHLFDSAADFRLASGTPVGFTAPVGGTVRLSTTVVKAVSGDDVRLCVQKYPAGWLGLDHPCDGSDFVPNGTDPVPSVVDLRTYASTAVSDSPSIDVQVTRGEQLVFRVETDLAIDPAALSWQISGSMTQVCDETPTCRATTPSEADELSFLADPFFPPHVAVEPGSIAGGAYSALPASAPLGAFVASAAGTLQIVTRQDGWSQPVGTFISARTKDGLLFKSGPSDLSRTISIVVKAGDRIYFEGHGDTTVPAGWSPVVTMGGTQLNVPVNLTQDAFLDVEGKRWQVTSAYGGGYHGWRRGAWHGTGSDPFDPGTFLVLLPYIVDPNRWVELETKLEDPQSPESLALAANAPLYPRRLGTRGAANDPGLKPDVPAFVSSDRNTFMTATTMHASIEETVSGVEPVPVYPGAVFARRSDTDSKQTGMDVTVLGVDQSSGKSWQSQEAIDLNGDRVLDGIFRISDGATAIALTPVDGSPPRLSGYGGGELLQESSDGGTSAYVGGHVGMPKIGGDSSVIQAIVGAPSTDAGVALSANLSTVQNDLVDVNGDGLPDRVSMPVPGVLMVELNLGGKFGAPDLINVGPWNAGKMDDIAKYVGSGGPDLFFKEPERVRRSVTVTLQSSAGASFVVGVGRSWESSIAATEVAFVDVTGDGLPDYVRKGPNDRVMYVRVNTGHGFGEKQAWNLPSWPGGATLPFLSGKGFFGGKVDSLLDAITGPRTMDVLEANGSYTSEASKSWGVSLGGSVGIFSFGGSYTEQKSTRQTGLQLGMIDIDGDGVADHVLKAEKRDGSSNAEVQVRLSRLGRANLLKHVTRPLGGAIDLFYARAGHTVAMPEHRWVLSQVTVRDGRGATDRDQAVTGHDLVTTYAYADGRHDRNEREFLGFGQVERTNGDGSHVVRTYRNDRYAFKGLLTGERVLDADRRTLVETVNEYGDPYSDPDYRRQSGEPSCDARRPFAYGPDDYWCGSMFPAPTRVEKRFYEREDAPRIVTRQEYHYDAFGNVDRFDDFGDVSAANTADDLHATVSYFADGLADGTNSVSRPKDLEAHDANGKTLRKRIGEYDARGNLHRLVSSVDDKTSVDSILDWDELGRMWRLQGPDVKGRRYTITYDFDQVVRTFVTATTDSHGYTSSAEWDYRFGEVTKTTDVNGNVTRRVLDAFERVTDVYGPYDTTAPTVHADFVIGAAAPYAITRNRLPEGGTLDTVTLVDGLARVIQTKKTALVYGRGLGWSVTGHQLFDAMGRVAVQGQTFFETGSSPLYRDGTPIHPKSTTYDALGRTVKTIESIEPTDDHPDGLAVTTMSYGFGAAGVPTRLTATVTDPMGKVRVMYRDTADRVVAVDERNTGQTATTRYDYDPLGQLLDVIDARGYSTSLAYDRIGRRTSLASPDAGTTTFLYDAAGNLTTKTDSRKVTIQYVYDYEQLRRIEYPNARAVTFEYGPPGALENGAGRIVRVGDDAGTETRGYGKLGELARTTRTIPALRPGDVEKVFETRFAFDSYGRMQWITYPDGETVRYAYDVGGLVRSAIGKRSASKHYPAAEETYLASLEYNEHGQRRMMTLGNGGMTKYDYYPESLRLQALHTEAAGQVLQALTYRYDRVGNVLGMTNSLPPPTSLRSGPVSFEFAYDDLYRLTSATGTAQSRAQVLDSFKATYGYDAIHNMTRNTQVHVLHTLSDPGDGSGTPARTNHDFGYEYDPKHPHQAIRIGETNLVYDAAGNTTAECRAPNATASAGCGPSADGLRRFYWTDESRLAAVIDGGGQNATRFIYDAGGERIVKQGRGGEGLTIGQFFSLKGRKAATKHVFVGSTRLASKLLPPPGWQPSDATVVVAPASTSTIPGCDPSNYQPNKCPMLPGGDPVLNHAADGTTVRPETYYYHPDHLGSTSWVTDQNGRVHEHVEYFPYGEVWRDVKGDTRGGPVKGQRFLFTAKEFDEETGLYYFGARYYDPVRATWTSPDPALDRYVPRAEETTGDRMPGGGGVFRPANLSLYSYASNTPIGAIDGDGRIVIIIHGTWAKDADWTKPGPFVNAVERTFNDTSYSFTWSGENTKFARSAAALGLAWFIESLPEGEPIVIVAHSHGGNVVKAYSQMERARHIDRVVTLGTPQRDDYEMNMSKVGEYVNVYSVNDAVQVSGGHSLTSSEAPMGETGAAGRRDPAATFNLAVNYVKKGGKLNPTLHGDLHTPDAWDRTIKSYFELLQNQQKK
jgi:RHS repeat-associated protein